MNTYTFTTYTFALIDVQYSITHGRYKTLEDAIKAMIRAWASPDCPIEADLTIFDANAKEVRISSSMINEQIAA